MAQWWTILLPLLFTKWWGAGVVICLERGADLHTAQLMPLPLTVSCFSKIKIVVLLPFWDWLTRVVPDKGPLNGCMYYSMYVYCLLSVLGVWGVGVATRNCDVQQVPLGCDSDSWVLRHDGSLYHSNAELCRLSVLPEEGDVIVSVRSAVFVIMYCSLITGPVLHF